MYRALYRKYRPLTFDDVIGQEHIVETIKNQIINNKISHAYMFTGTRGTGKTTCAKILARAVNCENPKNGNPCNECETCRSILNGSLTDVFEIDAASNNGVDSIRELREDVIFTPALAKYKVYIIDEVHMLSTQAFNALLKTLEEPPEHIIFIFATTEINKVLPTILSRCQRFDFKRITVNDIKCRIQKVAQWENVSIDDSAAALIARLADGAMRDALSILDRCLVGNDRISLDTVEHIAGVCSYDDIAYSIGAVANNDTAAILEFYSKCRSNSKDAVSVFSELCCYFRDMIVVKLVNNTDALPAYDEQRLADIKKLADKFELEKIVRCISVLQSGIYDISRFKDKHIMAEMTLIKLTTPELGSSLDDLSARIAKLEKIGVQPQMPAENTNKSVAEKSTAFQSSETADASSENEIPVTSSSKKIGKSSDLTTTKKPLTECDFITGLFEAIQALKGISVLPFLSESNITSDQDTLYIKCSKDDFAYSILSSEESKSLIEAAAMKCTGKKYALRFIQPDENPVSSSGTDQTDVLGELLSSAADILDKE